MKEPLLVVQGVPLPRPGRRARVVARGGGGLAAVSAAAAVLFKVEAHLARKTIGRPTTQPPQASGSYGRGRPLLRMAVLGDSAAAGLGADEGGQTPGGLLAGSLARELGRRVHLEVVAVSGSRTAALDVQVGRALGRPLDLAFIIVGANDVTGRVAPAESARELGRAVRTLRAAGAQVVVGTCPDLGTIKPLLQPLRGYARYASRRLATAQTVAVVEEGGLAVSLGNLLGRDFAAQAHLFSADRFHPSPQGYQRIADAVLPSLLEALGAPASASVPVSDSVQDLAVAARVASREPGLAVETVQGEDGAAGAGRLARLRRRLPLIGLGAPAVRDDSDEAEDRDARDTEDPATDHPEAAPGTGRRVASP